LERALIVLDQISRKPGGLTNKQISEELGIATSSSSYLLGRLEKEGFLSRNTSTGRYKIGLKVLAIAQGALRQLDFRTVAAPLLRQLAAHTGVDVVMGVLDRERLMVVSRVANSEFIDVQVDAGTEFPAHATATGKLLLANLPRQELLALMKQNRLVRLTEHTITDEHRLLAELESVADQGYATCNEEHTLGRRSLGAPIVDPRGNVRAALALAGDVHHPFWEKPLPEVVRVVKAAAQEISRLGRYGFAPVFPK
jgi:IclR family acetate operon transcriptional repressor